MLTAVAQGDNVIEVPRLSGRDLALGNVTNPVISGKDSGSNSRRNPGVGFRTDPLRDPTTAHDVVLAAAS